MNKRNFIWNMLGSGIYSMATVLFVMLAKRIVGEEAGAGFYMAFTTGQMLLTIGYFEMRPFQVTDVAYQYKPEEYFGFRGLTCLAMLLGGVVVGLFYVLNQKADGAGFILIMTLCLLKLFDGLADVLEGEFQRKDRIDISGKSMAFRTLASMFVFTAVAYVTRNIYIASAAAALTGLFGVIAVGMVWHKFFSPFHISFDKEKMKGMFNGTFSLFISSAMCMWIWNGTKYVVEWNCVPAQTLIYGIIYMPTMVINLGSSFIFKPMLTTLARYYKDNEIKAFFKTIGILSLGTLALTLVTLAGGALLGVPVLSWLYDIDISQYKSAMLVLITAGGFNALGIVLYYGLMVMRKQWSIFAGYLVTFVVSIFLPVTMVRKNTENALLGAAVSYLLIMLLLAVLFAALLVKGAMTKKRE